MEHHAWSPREQNHAREKNERIETWEEEEEKKNWNVEREWERKKKEKWRGETQEAHGLPWMADIPKQKWFNPMIYYRFSSFALSTDMLNKRHITPWPRHFLLHTWNHRKKNTFYDIYEWILVYFFFTFILALERNERAFFVVSFIRLFVHSFESENLWPASKKKNELWLYFEIKKWIWTEHEKGLIVFVFVANMYITMDKVQLKANLLFVISNNRKWITHP